LSIKKENVILIKINDLQFLQILINDLHKSGHTNHNNVDGDNDNDDDDLANQFPIETEQQLKNFEEALKKRNYIKKWNTHFYNFNQNDLFWLKPE